VGEGDLGTYVRRGSSVVGSAGEGRACCGEGFCGTVCLLPYALPECILVREREREKCV
jgi:hypothetical protein